jgi:hypothetical protein
MVAGGGAPAVMIWTGFFKGLIMVGEFDNMLRTTGAPHM